MKLIKTTFFSAIITFIRIASGFVGGKVLAVFTGAPGMAIIGAFTNFITIILTFANGAINTGVIKYTAEYNEDKERLKILFSTAFKISVYCSTVIGTLLITFAPYFSFWIFTEHHYVNPIRVLGFTIILYSLNSLLISILNGRGQIKDYTLVNTIGSLISLVFTITLVFLFKIEGALYAIVLSQSIVFFITAALTVKSSWFSWTYFNHAFNKLTAIKLSHYSLMAIVSALTVPLSQIIIRNILIAKINIEAAGYWQGLMRISDGYLMLITTSLSTYYLPTLSSLNNTAEIRTEIIRGYKIILPLVLFGCLMIYYLRFYIIKILYTSDFIVMESLFLWQLIGDFFKIAAWMLSYLLLAKAMIKIFVYTEILFSLSYIGLSLLLIDFFELRGITISFALNYFLYLILMLFIFRKTLFHK